MGELTYLLSSYSGAELIIIFVAGLLAVTAIIKACGFLWDKIKDHFGMINADTTWKNNLTDKIDKVGSDLGILQTSVNQIQADASERAERLKKVEEFVQADYEREEQILQQHEMMKSMCKRVQTRLQDDTRWSFKDAYNYYYIKEGKIDSNSLESLEKKYEHYKEAGGNSFVDNIMERLRELPIVDHMGADAPRIEGEQHA